MLDNDIAELLEVCRDCHVKHPKLHRDTHSGMYREARKDVTVESSAAAKARRRNERKLSKGESRLGRALRGEFTPVRTRVVA